MGFVRQFSILLSASVSLSNTAITYEAFSTDEWKRMPPLQILWRHRVFNHVLECAVPCVRDVACSSYQYHPTAHICVGYSGSLIFKTKDAIKPLHGARFYSKKKEPGTLGTPCRNKKVCKFTGSSCYRGQCLCKPGYSYIYSRQKCVRKCIQYGSEFTSYPGISFRARFGGKIDHSQNFAECMEACLTEKSFQCLTAEMWEGKGCCIRNVGYLDVPRRSRGSRANKFVIMTRNCQL